MLKHLKQMSANTGHSGACSCYNYYEIYLSMRREIKRKAAETV